MDKSTFCKQLSTGEYRNLPQVSFSDLKLCSIFLGGSPQKYQYFKQLELAKQELEEEGILEPEQQKKAVAFGNAFHMYMADPEKVKIMSVTGPDESTQFGIFINTVAREERTAYIEKYKTMFPKLDVNYYKEDFLQEFASGYYSSDNTNWTNSSSVIRAFNATQSKKYKTPDFFLKELDLPENKAFFKALVTYNPETELLVTQDVRETLQRSIDNLKNHNFYKHLYNESDAIKVHFGKESDGKTRFDFSVWFRELQIVTEKKKGIIDNLKITFSLDKEDGLFLVRFSISDYKTNYSSCVDYIESEKFRHDNTQLCYYQDLILNYMLEQEEDINNLKNVFVKSLFESVKEEYFKTCYLKETDSVQKEISEFFDLYSSLEHKESKELSIVFDNTIFHIQTTGKYNPVTPIRFVYGQSQENTIVASLEEYEKMKEQKGDYSGFMIDYDDNFCMSTYIKDMEDPTKPEKEEKDEF
ncbi:MAG: hypothetical protein EBU90_01705 [Proteobacteria bacterium]|nr:hypothetical protein [Pseudomonadota bacterium]